MNFITDNIAIGDCYDAEDQSLLQSLDIRSIISLNGQLIGRTPESLGVTTLHAVNLWDGPGNDPLVFDEALTALRRFADAHPNVLVHCHLGKSRSVVLVAAFLILAKGMEAEDAIDWIAARRDVRLSGGITDLLRKSRLLNQQ